MPAGRPSIGPNIKVALPQGLLDDVDAFAERLGATRAAAIRHLLESALRIGNADATLDVLGEHGIEAVFPEAEDGEELYERIRDETDETVLYAECVDEAVPHPMYLDLVKVRGRWVLTRSERPGETWEHRYRVFTDETEARTAFAEAMTAITAEHWTPEIGEPMWCELSDLEFIYDLARSGAIPAGAIDAEGDLYPLDTLIADAGVDLDDDDAIAKLTRGVDRRSIAAAVNRLKAARV